MTKKPLITPAEINLRNAEYWEKRGEEIRAEFRMAQEHPGEIEKAFAAMELACRSKIDPMNDPPSLVAAFMDALDTEKILRTARLARRGEKFAPNGRGKSPITKRMESLLKKHPDMKNAELWKQVTQKLSKGWTVTNEPRIFPEPFMESPDGESLTYSTFRVKASAIRKQLRQG